ncbi:ABC transporter G family member 29 [Phytophthora cactorum]|uniref:ABC transporter G family member 29 n=1 Tax=Phytophthora cactorum TaxID=29920 RepID=A0A329RXY0_9STRA|nr:ABC transporter G family member 29 [Phytophthora cactorum]KAG2804356.1 ABC transporter G family member 29 [Phytophthora cactorum]KAG2809386.1 ABC transporter G family member 29 [Phytophthora cactorum]KAG2850683.1 ABC transporter G family member 29 [Phytophthora cactorum]KAG2882556.1 ABC transporter G family member 29 [Phytophthora cactorum]
MEQPDVSSADGLLAGGILAMHENLAAAVENTLSRPIPEVEISFRDLHISARLPLAKPGSEGPQVPTIWTQVKQGVMKCFSSQETAEKEILRGITGVFKPTRITLVLGQPGSGKSSLLKMLSGRFPMDKTIKESGEITYNGVQRSDVLARLPRFIAYTNQKDDHYPQLTVQETFEFAQRCCGGATLEPWVLKALETCKGEQHERAVNVMTAQHKFAAEIRVKALGLDRCKDTIVGNAMTRGVSGGERKRVTTGEMTFGRKRALLLDEISTGLDAATTYDIVTSLKSLTRHLKANIVVSLLQPPPEVFNLFDDILILNDGRVMYHGPRDQVQEYFENIGFLCPPRKDVADFLLDLGTEKQHAYISGDSTDVNGIPFESVEFAERFRQSRIFQDTLTYMRTRSSHKSDLFDPIQDPCVFRQSFLEDLGTLLHRQWKLKLRDRTFIIGRCFMVLIMGLLYGSVFWQMNDANSQLILGLLFSCTLFLSMGQAAQLPTFMGARSVFYKQRGANFFRSLAYVLASSLTQIPFAMFETLLFGSIVYWMGGYVVLADRFISFLVTLFLCQMWFTAYFFFLSAAAPSLAMAQPVMMVSILFLMLFGGFLLRKTDIPEYFIWFYWIDSVAWSIRSLSVNQYLAPKFDVCVYGGIDYCSRFGTTFGKYSLELSGLPTEEAWIYLGWLYFVVGYVLLVLAAHLVLEYKRYESPESTTVVQADLDVKEGKTNTVNVSATVPEDVAVSIVTPRQSALPVTVAFHDLWYSVPMPGGKKGEDIDLLQGVSGYAKPGTMTALMGSSGAGKTTLMDVIAGRKTGGKIRGKILLNGYPATDLAIRRSTGYCEQMDIHSESATIREALVFSAMLRQSASVPTKEKIESVDECITLLELGPIADKIIRGSSTEQMKRLTIGVELVAQPSIIFMDEPTSGLDARSAKLIMNGVRKIATSGRTIVCTIHQPSSEVFSFFDSLLLLRRGGRMVFFGELGKDSSNLIKYFEAAPGVTPIEPGYNPATWMLECIGAGVGASSRTEMDFAEYFSKSDLNAGMEKDLNKDGLLRPSPDLPELKFSKQFASTRTMQFKLLCRRFFYMYWRTPMYNLTRLMVSVMLGAIFGIIYQATDYSTFTGANAGVGLVFISTVFLGIIGFNSVMPIAADERTAFYRERASETYHALWYFIAGTLVEIPYVMLSALAFTIIFFPSVGFTGFGTFISYWLVVSLNALLFVYFGQLLVFALPSVAVASIAGALLSSIFMLFSGFNPPANNIAIGYKWIYYISPPTYSIATLVAMVFADCPDGTSSNIGCQVLKNAPPTVGNISLKQYVEHAFDMKSDHIPRNVVILGILIVVFRLLALLSLRYISHLKR